MDYASRDAVLALAKLDKIEAGVRDNSASAIAEARSVVADAMSSADGSMFVLQDIKAMLVWMQKEDAGEAEGGTLTSLWSMINQNATDEQRNQFNQFRTDLYCDADAVRDWARVVSLVADKALPNSLDSLVDRISRMPVLAD
jgi:hypothetical protein